MEHIDTLVAFVRVADLGSLSAAGQSLAISASGVGKIISRLEERLGVRLLHRSTRSLTLTAEGELFLARCRRILVEVDAGAEELVRAKSEAVGRLKIALPLVGEIFLPAIVTFQQAYPAVTLDLQFTNHKFDIIEEGYDAIVRHGDIEDSALSMRVLGMYRLQLVAAPAYLAARGTPVTPRDLLTHACIQYRNPRTGKLEPWPLRLAGGEALQLPATMTCNLVEVRRSLAIAGIGIASLPDFSVRAALAAGLLVTVLDDHTDPQQDLIRLLWPSGRHMTPRLRAFIDHFCTHQDLTPYPGMPTARPSELSA